MPQILAVASAVDLDFRYGCTPAWWQLWKGLYEAGCDLIVTPYRGRPDGVALVADRAEPVLPRGRELRSASATASPGSSATRIFAATRTARGHATDRLMRQAIWRWVTPRWQRHLERILERGATSTP